ncbi:DUF624 domain-containing protein [Brachybacterium sp. DNPG3]
MKGLMAADSPLQRMLGRVADVMILNLLFLLACLPVVTIGAALTALNFSALKMVEGSTESVHETFLRSFRRNFRQSTVLIGITVGILAVLLAWWIVATNLQISGLGLLVIYGALIMIALRLLTFLLFLFPYHATFEGDTREVLRNARKMSARHPLAALAMAAVLVLPMVATATDPALAGYGLLWLLFGFGAIACVNAFLLRAVFARYIPTPKEAS